jgi:hypothetical protein
LGRHPDPLPLPRPGEVTVSMLSAEETKEECDCDDCDGCAWSWYQGSFIRRGRILISSTTSLLSAAAHEIGHELGLGHVINAAGVRPPFTMGVTTDGQFSPRDQLDVLDPATVRMLETLYGAGLTAGASRRQFEALGLVPPEPSGIAPRPRTALKTIRDGLETIVIRPLCGARP